MGGPYWMSSEDRPNKDKDPLAWERSWERDFTRVHSHWKWKRGRLSDLIPKDAVVVCCGDSSALALGHHTRHLVGLQGHFAAEAAQAFAMCNFEGRWREISQVSRRHFILQGICNSLSTPDADIDRPWCPDSTLTHLSSRNGDALLEMMKSLIPTDLLSPIAERDPIFLPHPLIDRVCDLTEEEKKQPGYYALAYNAKISRSRLLTEIVYNTLRAFLGWEPLKRGEWKGHASKRTVESVLRDLPESLRSLESVRSAAESMADSEPKTERGRHQCWACGVKEKPGERMQGCTKCRGVGRRVTYCSQACQVKDWKTGYHKQICGKSLSEDDIASLADGLRLVQRRDTPDYVTNRFISGPNLGYTHTPTLTHQILTLSRVKGAQYVIFHPDLADTDPENPYLFMSFPGTDSTLAFLFLIFRNRAFMTGNIEDVKAIYTLLVVELTDPDAAASFGHVQRQLENEFNVDLSDGVLNLETMILEMADPTPEEVKRAELDLAWQRILPTDIKPTAVNTQARRVG